MKDGQTGFYRGIVVKHLPAGKVKVFIPGIYKDEFQEQPDKLPDAELATPVMSGGAGGNGVFSYPDINAVVWCFFMNDDVNYPIVFAQTLGSSQGKTAYKKVSPGIKQADDGTTSGMAEAHYIKAGKSSIFLHEGGMVVIKVSNGGIITIDKEGNVIINADQLQASANNMLFSAANQIDMQAGESITMRFGTSLNIVGAPDTSGVLIQSGSLTTNTRQHTQTL